jgi:large subunit ribosomal protein L24
MTVKKNDTVYVRVGKDKGKTGLVLKVFPAAGMVLVEGVNVYKKHSRPVRRGQQGQIVEKPMPIRVDNVSVKVAGTKPASVKAKKTAAK